MIDQLNTLASKLSARCIDNSETRVVVGFDAFLDESIRIVGERESPHKYQSVGTIGAYGDWVNAAAGHSGSREFVTQEMQAGGCSINMGDGLASAGFSLCAFSGVGEVPNAAFAPFLKGCESHCSLGMDPGRAIVTEFDDGKLMLCSMSHFATFTPSYLRQQFTDGGFRATCEAASGIVLTSWSVYPFMTECWRYLHEEVLVGMAHRPKFFFDLADPASRSNEDIAEMLRSLQGFEEIGSATLSLNGNEANRVARAVGIREAEDHLEAQGRLCRELRDAAGISEVSIHLVHGAATSSVQGEALIEGPYCAKPKKSVGAGDRFNAGFFGGVLLGLSPEERLQLGSASSGFFVRHARSASSEELVEFLRQWAAGQFAA